MGQGSGWIFQWGEHALITEQPPAGAAGVMISCFLGAIGDQRPNANAGIWFRVAQAWLVMAAVDIKRLLAALAIGEKPRKTIWQAEMRRDLGAIGGTAEDPKFRCGISLRHRLDAAIGVIFGQGFTMHPGIQIGHIIGEFRRSLIGLWVQGKGGATIRPRGAAKAKINPARGQSVKHAELFSDF